ncbi:hypothetical protein EV363DRAFT_1162570 [Boletus edulis]|nr:hypothetical protein EV363DRAFT_1162570 [Boletus edulis]
MPPAVTLTPDVCSRIVHWARRSDLTALCLTCKALQHEAEAKLYEIIMTVNIQITFRACQSIISHPRLGPYVRSFCFIPETRRTQREIPEQFWSTLQRALSRMRSLEYLFLQDPAFASSWVLSDIPHIPFQLLEARLLFYWDSHLVKFLESQNKLKSLHTIDGPANDPTLHLEAGSLSELRVFDGPLAAAEHIVHVGSALTHLQVVLDKNSEADVLAFIPKLFRLASSLRALSILHLPEGLAIDAFRSITKACPQLRHIGTIPLPLPRNSYRFHGTLMAMPQLRVLEVDVTSWTPPTTGTVQRVIAAEIRIYAPLIEYICFWAGATRTLWAVDGNDWSCHSESGQHSQFDALWKTSC